MAPLALYRRAGHARRALRRGGRAISAIVAIATAGSLAFTASPARAFNVHTSPPTYFGGSGTNALSNPTDVAVDNSSDASSGDVWVTDPANHRVEKFDSAGNFLLMIGKAVDQTTGGNICTVASGDTCQAGKSGTSPGEFETPTFVAVDNSSTEGDIYVGDTEDNKVSKFDSSGNLITSWGDAGPNGEANGQLGPFAELQGIAVDPSGNLYVAGSPSEISWYEPDGELHDIFGAPYSPGRLGLAIDGEDNLYNANGQVEKFSDTGNLLAYIGGGPSGFTINPSTNELFIDEGGGSVNRLEFNCGDFCPAVESFGAGSLEGAGGISVNATTEMVYVANTSARNVAAFGATVVPNVISGLIDEPGQTSATLTGTVDPLDGGSVTECYFEYGEDTSYSLGRVPCEQATPYTGATEVTAKIAGLTSEVTYHYRLVAANAKGSHSGFDRTVTPHYVIGLATEAPTNLTGTSVDLNGSFVGNGTVTHYYFNWGETTSYGNTTEIPPGVDGGSPVGPTKIAVPLANLLPGTTYHYQFVASNESGTTVGEDQPFTTPPIVPGITGEAPTVVQSDLAQLRAEIDPGGTNTKYQFEYGTEDCETHPGACISTPIPSGELASATSYQSVSVQLGNLTHGTTYYWRVVATNVIGTTYGLDRTFTTYPFLQFHDSCPNAHVRQQTSAALLPDCRAYELVSTANSDGYDVESDLIAGQTPYPSYPEAENPSRVLYAMHGGAIPGTNNPTNRGPDPYVATRTPGGWTTEYVGVPADNPFSAAPFSSVPSGADSNLETFAFGSAGGCSPCFEGGYTGIPLRLPDGMLVQGMVAEAGLPTPPASASPDGYVANSLSANGEHLIFGSTAKFASSGNSGGPVSIYDRNLKTDETHVVSNSSEVEGQPLPCLQSAGEGECHAPKDSNGISELDISSDGSHILLGQKVSEGPGNDIYWHLYMDIDDSPKTIDLTSGASKGVLFDGMTSDGSKVFFSSEEHLTHEEEAHSGDDIYQADVSETSANLTLISKGETEEAGKPGDSSSCHPVSNSSGPHWNTAGAGDTCSVVAIGGGGGVAASNGTFYFLSPEQLDGLAQGTENQPNLYIVTPGGAPRFVATLAADDPTVIDAVTEAGVHRSGDFEVTPDGQFSVFSTSQPIEETYENAGHLEIYRFDSATGELNCASCDPTGTAARSDASLAPIGLSLTDDGRVFFTTAEPLVERDGDERKDVYEWESDGTVTAEGNYECQLQDGCVDLVSTGSSPFDATLLGVSANGANAYFFTRDKLVPQDENGYTVKIYDARELGGFEFIPPPVPCKASDECHGPSSPAPPQPDIHVNTGSSGNEVTAKCRRAFKSKNGKCVRKVVGHKSRRHQKKARKLHNGGHR